MAVEGGPAFDISLTVGAVSLATKQFNVAKMDSGGLVTIHGAVTDVPMGIIQGNPAASGVVGIRVSGISKVKAGGTIAIGDFVGSNGDGTVKTIVPGTDTTIYVIGIALSGGASGDTISVLVDCASPGRAA